MQILKLIQDLGPGLSDDVTKSEKGKLRIWPKGHTNRENAKAEMPTVKTDPRLRAVHYFYRALERIDITDTISISLLMALLKGSGIRSKLAVLRKHPRFRSLVHFFFRSHFILYKSTYCFANVLSQEMMHLKSYTIYPSDPNRRHLPRLDSASPLWNSVQGQQIFEFRFRLRHDYFTRALTGMNFVDNNGVKMLRVGSSGHHWLIRVDTALMILLRHLAFPSRFADHVDEFNMPSIRIAEAFHAMNDNLFVRHAHKLTDISRIASVPTRHS